MKYLFLVSLLCVVGLGVQAQEKSAVSSIAVPKTLYEINFEKIEVGKVPEEFLVLDGAFAVKEEKGNKFLELPGTPLETYGLLFGPNSEAGTIVYARVFGTAKGRRFPSFAVGLNGQAGYKLQVSPAKKVLEILRGDQVLHQLPYEWKTGSWTHLKLWISKAKEGGKNLLQGKAWEDSTPEPAVWTITTEESAASPSGRASIWGTPYSGTPIQFDDLRLSLDAIPIEGLRNP